MGQKGVEKATDSSLPAFKKGKAIEETNEERLFIAPDIFNPFCQTDKRVIANQPTRKKKKV
jgi:hypothetical protein